MGTASGHSERTEYDTPDRGNSDSRARQSAVRLLLKFARAHRKGILAIILAVVGLYGGASIYLGHVQVMIGSVFGNNIINEHHDVPVPPAASDPRAIADPTHDVPTTPGVPTTNSVPGSVAVKAPTPTVSAPLSVVQAPIEPQSTHLEGDPTKSKPPTPGPQIVTPESENHPAVDASAKMRAKYVVANTWPAGTNDKRRIAVLAVEEGKGSGSVTRNLVQSFEQAGFVVNDALFSSMFVSDQLFMDIFDGNCDQFADLNLAKECSYLGFATVTHTSKAHADLQNRISTDATVAVRIIATKTGLAVEDFEISGHGSDWNEKKALAAANADLNTRFDAQMKAHLKDLRR
jgi:hypothetical protein